MYEAALNILNKLDKLGYESYIVGGFARDLYLKINSSDIDICTSATPDIIKNLFFVIKDNSKFGSVIIEFEKYNFEITTFRKDEYINNRFPKITFVNSLKVDLQRRDFIINTLCIDKDGNVVDLMKAINDIDNKIINCVGEANIKLSEDPLRILRCIRFACKLNFTINEDVTNSIKKYTYKLKSLSNKRVKKEINAILKLENGMDYIKNFNLEEYIH